MVSLHIHMDDSGNGEGHHPINRVLIHAILIGFAVFIWSATALVIVVAIREAVK